MCILMDSLFLTVRYPTNTSHTGDIFKSCHSCIALLLPRYSHVMSQFFNMQVKFLIMQHLLHDTCG